MYRSTATFPEICSYISPGTAHEKWVKTYSAKLSKLWFPYEWFDTAEKLDFPGMPPHEEWFSKLKNEMTLSEEAYRLVSESGRKKGCERFRFCCSFTTIWISSLLLKPWSQSEIPTRGWESIFSKMRYLFCVARLTKETLRSCTPQGRRPTKFSKAQFSGGGLVFCRKRESVRTSSKTRRCVQELWPTTQTRCIQAQWRSLRNGRKRQGTSKSLSKFCRETDGLDSPKWTSRCQESYGRSSKKCRRCFKTNPFQARLYRST